VTDQLALAAYALAAAVDQRNGDPIGTIQPVPLDAFVADLRALTRGEVRPHDSVRSDPWPVPR
jgi:hypothetical protein